MRVDVDRDDASRSIVIAAPRAVLDHGLAVAVRRLEAVAAVRRATPASSASRPGRAAPRTGPRAAPPRVDRRPRPPRARRGRRTPSCRGRARSGPAARPARELVVEVDREVVARRGGVAHGLVLGDGIARPRRSGSPSGSSRWSGARSPTLSRGLDAAEELGHVLLVDERTVVGRASPSGSRATCRSGGRGARPASRARRRVIPASIGRWTTMSCS